MQIRATLKRLLNNAKYLVELEFRMRRTKKLTDVLLVCLTKLFNNNQPEANKVSVADIAVEFSTVLLSAVLVQYNDYYTLLAFHAY